MGTKKDRCGYNEIQNPKQRYSLINRQKSTALLGIKDNDQLSEYRRNWVEQVLKNGSNQRDAKWTESIAVGDKEFVMQTKAKLGAKALAVKRWRIMRVMNLGNRKVLTTLFLPLKSGP